MKRSGFKRPSKKPEPAKPSKIAARRKTVTVVQQPKPVEADERCPYWFPEHFTHARQQCIREAGHKLPHHCGGIKK